LDRLFTHLKQNTGSVEAAPAVHPSPRNLVPGAASQPHVANQQSSGERPHRGVSDRGGFNSRGRGDRAAHRTSPYQTQRPDARRPARRERCSDYDNQGFCLRGDLCPYEHGDDRIIVEDPMLAPQFGRGGGPMRGRGGRGRGGAPRQEHTDVPLLGKRQEACILVLELVPAVSCTEEALTTWFAKFGKVVKVTTDIVGKRASVQFETHDEAQTAYDSPDAIFGNRFVKVFFYKPRMHGPLPGMGPESRFTQDRTAEVAAAIDAAKQAALAAKVANGEDEMMVDASAETPELSTTDVKERMEKLQQLKEKEEQIKKEKLEMQIKLAKLQAKQSMAAGGPAVVQTASAPVAAPTTQSTSALKEALAAKVATLKAEAAALGIPDPTARLYGNGPPIRGRGAPRGGPRGGGAPRGGMMGGGRKLDLRSRKIAVANVAPEHKDQIEEHFGAFGNLVGILFETDKAIVEFATRPEAEAAMTKGTKTKEDNILSLVWHQDKPQVPSMVEVTNTTQ